jgi:3-dehydroquinate synthase
LSGDLSFEISGVRTVVQFSAALALPDAGVTVFDARTFGLFGAGARNPVVLPAGEQAKTWESVREVLERGASLGLGRDGLIAGVGGGVVCDITAFAASLYMRGCGLALVPTTLLAMVDASLGGKTGIDFSGFKNLVGTFYPAARILIAPGAVASLPEREYRSGLAEVIKTGIIGDPNLLALLDREQAAVTAREPAVVEALIRMCLAVKGRIVQEDPREEGMRAFLNLGHTFGHALESATGFSELTHGEAVAWGIGRALALGVRMGLADPSFAAETCALLKRYGFHLEARAPFADLGEAFARDKKRRGGRIRIVIPCAAGDVRVVEAAAEEIAAVLGTGST